MADLLRLFKRSRNQPIALRILLALALISSLIVTGSSPASAVPGAPTITSITSSGTTGSVDVTVVFTRAAGGTTPSGYIYSTNNGATWAQCNSSNCTWNGTATSIVIQKLSNATSSLQADDTYQVVIAECSTGSPDQKREPTASISSLGLQGCGSNSSTVSYVAGTSFSAGAPSISTSSTIANGASNPTITITGADFETPTVSSMFNVATGTTGLTFSSITFNSATSLTFNFTGNAVAGSVTISATTTAYNPDSSEASNTVSVTVPAILPETPTAISAGSATSSSLVVSWTAPSNNGGAAISDYWLQYSSNSGSTWETFTASASATASRTVTGLTASTSYIFRVAAKNSVGYGPFSDSSTAVSTSAASAPAPAPAPEVIPAPIITKVSKTLVCARGGDEILIQGSYLANATITIDGKAVQGRGNSSNSVLITLEEATSGTKVLKLTTPSGTASTTLTYKLVDRTAFKVFDIPYIYKGGEFSYIFEAFGENTFRVTGKFPAGLTLNSATGEISGIPTEEGVFNFVLHADGVCGNDVDVIRLDIDKEIPNAMSCQIKFPNKKTNKIGASQLFALKKCLDQAKKISPKQIDPVIIITGGAPEGEAEIDSEEAKARRDAICDVLLTQDILAQTIAGIFSGEPDVIEIFVYWPVPR